MVDAIGLRVVSGVKLPTRMPVNVPQPRHEVPQVRFEGNGNGRRFLWMALLTSLISIGGGTPTHKPAKADNISILDSIAGPAEPAGPAGEHKPVTETQKSPSATPELSWLNRKGPTREMDVATLLEIAEKKDKALDDKLKQADVKANKDRLKRVTEAKEKLSKALAATQAAHKKDPNSDDTTLKAKALIEACIVDPSLRLSKETWAPNVVRWAACDQTQGAGFHKIADPFLDVLERPDTPGAYQAMLAVQRIPALAWNDRILPGRTTTVASATPSLPPPRVVLDMGPPAPARVSTLTGLTGLSGGTLSNTGSSLGSTTRPVQLLVDDDLFTARPSRLRPPRDRFLEMLQLGRYDWNDRDARNPFEFPFRQPRRNVRPTLLLDLPTVTEERPFRLTELATPRASTSGATTRPAILTGLGTPTDRMSGPSVISGGMGSSAAWTPGSVNNMFGLAPDLGPLPGMVNNPTINTLTPTVLGGLPSMYGAPIGWSAFDFSEMEFLMGGSGDGRSQVRFTSPNIDTLKDSWLKAQNKEMAGKRKVMVVYHAQEAFKPEVIIFIKKMASAYGLSLGDNKPADIDKLIRAEKSADFGDFIVVCPKGKTAEGDISAAFDRMETFTKGTPGANGWVYVDAHGSEEGVEPGFEDLEMLEGSRKGITHFPDDAKISKAFWIKQSHKLKGFTGAVPFWIDTCHSASNLVMADPPQKNESFPLARSLDAVSTPADARRQSENVYRLTT